MAGSDPLLIDDVEQCLARMTDLGRVVVTGPVEAIRGAVLDHAGRRGWTVMPHSAYAVWAGDLAISDERPWIVLDPLFPGNTAHSRLHPLRLTRRFAASGAAVVLEAEFDWQRHTGGQPVGVIDDACASGRTLVAVARAIRDVGGQVARVVVCASSHAGRENFSRAAGSIRWDDYARGDWKVAHLRDGCPHLPYSARLTHHPPATGPHGATEFRLPATALQDNLWTVLWMNAAVRAAITVARAEIVARLSKAIGRPARVTDLPLLGPSIPALLDPERSAPTADDTLEGPVPPV